MADAPPARAAEPRRPPAEPRRPSPVGRAPPAAGRARRYKVLPEIRAKPCTCSAPMYKSAPGRTFRKPANTRFYTIRWGEGGPAGARRSLMPSRAAEPRRPSPAGRRPSPAGRAPPAEPRTPPAEPRRPPAEPRRPRAGPVGTRFYLKYGQNLVLTRPLCTKVHPAAPSGSQQIQGFIRLACRASPRRGRPLPGDALGLGRLGPRMPCARTGGCPRGAPSIGQSQLRQAMSPSPRLTV